MPKISIKSLIECGVHFGHSTSRWNPKMAPYIYGKRNSIYIIDLRETIKSLLNACNFLTKLAARGGEVLFVGTKKAAKIVVSEEAQRAEMPWATERWLGGCFTNFTTIKLRVKRLDLLEELEKTGRINNYSKKIVAKYGREKRKLLRNLGGIRYMARIPDCLVVVDPRRERSAVAEAIRMRMPVIALTDTDCDPENIDIIIPGNDDAMRSVKYLISLLAEAVIEGRRQRSPIPVLATPKPKKSNDKKKIEKPKSAIPVAKTAEPPTVAKTAEPPGEKAPAPVGEASEAVATSDSVPESE